MVPDFADCPPGYTRDFWFIFATPSTLSSAPCDLPKGTFVIMCALWAVLFGLVGFLVVVGALMVKAKAARKQLLSLLPHSLAALALFVGSSFSTAFWSGDPSSIVFILLALWAGFLFAHVLSQVQELKKLAGKIIPAELSKDAKNVKLNTDLMENILFGLSALFIFMFVLSWAVLVPVSNPFGGQGDNLYLDSDGKPSKNLWWAVGCWMHPLTNLTFIAIPIRHIYRIVSHIKILRIQLENALGGEGAVNSEYEESRAKRNRDVRAFELKLSLGAVQAVACSLVAQSLWIVVSDQRILGMKWMVPFILVLVGLGFDMSILLFYFPLHRVTSKFSSSEKPNSKPKQDSRDKSNKNTGQADSATSPAVVMRNAVVPKEPESSFAA